jgi:hypothetical protein
MKVIKVGSAAQSRIAQACDRYVMKYRQLLPRFMVSIHDQPLTAVSQMPKQEDTMRWRTTLLFTVCQRRIRMQDQRQAQPTRLPQRLHRESGGASTDSGDGSTGTERLTGRKG